MSCFKFSCCKCFTDRTAAAATTIGKYARGNQARGNYKKRQLLAAAVLKVTVLGMLQPRAIKVSADEKSLRYSKPTASAPAKDLLFADMTKISIATTDVKIVMKSRQSYTLRAETAERARNIYFALSQYVDPKVMLSTPVAPVEAKK